MGCPSRLNMDTGSRHEVDVAPLIYVSLHSSSFSIFSYELVDIVA